MGYITVVNDHSDNCEGWQPLMGHHNCTCSLFCVFSVCGRRVQGGQYGVVLIKQIFSYTFTGLVYSYIFIEEESLSLYICEVGHE